MLGAVICRLTMSIGSQRQGQAEGYAPRSGQIIGILKKMKDTIEAGLTATITQEEKAKAEYEALMVAKRRLTYGRSLVRSSLQTK